MPVQIGYERSKLADIQERQKVLKKKIVKQRGAMGGVSAAETQDVKVILTSIMFRGGGNGWPHVIRAAI